MNKLLFSVWLLIIAIAGGVLFVYYQPFQKKETKLVPLTEPTATLTQSKGSALPFPLTMMKGFQVNLFASEIPNARDMQFTAKGTVLVSSPTTGSVYAVRDTNSDGFADERKIILSSLDQPHGLAVYQNYLFVAEVTKVVRYILNEDTLTATQDKVLFSLPQNANHNKRTLLIDKQGTMYISVGSTCNVCIERDQRNGTVLISDITGKTPQIYSSGLRNAPFMAFNPDDTTIWVTEMGRDNLGDNLPPDEINILKEKANFGWPLCYGDRIHDTEFDKKTYIADPCRDTVAPTFAIPAHSAPLGLAFIPESFSKQYKGDLLVAYHGSWNRSTPTGYKVVLIDRNGKTLLQAADFLTGFLTNGDATGRPVDITFDTNGSAYISDDKAGNIYRVVSQ